MRVTVSTPDVVGARMAGPGIRAYHLARELGRHFETTLVAVLRDFDPAGEPFTAVAGSTPDATRVLTRSDVVVGQPTREILALPRKRMRLVYDLFDPVVLELSELYGSKPTLRETVHFNREWGRLRMALAQGDLLVYAAPRQRDFYAGVHLASGGDGKGWIDKWIAVPFGVEPPPPPGDRDDPPLIVWGGGRWEWLDPASAVAAVEEVNRRGTRSRLLFLGGSRPNEQVGRLASAAAVIRPGEVVIENRDWVPYRERWTWLRRSTAAIMLHRKTVEAEFSIRTRLFDAIWCGLPVIATAGGYAADMVDREGIGIVVAPSDVAGIASAVERMIHDDTFHAACVSNLDRIRPSFAWSEVVRPLVQKIAEWD